MRGRNVTRSREKIPIVVPVFHREEDTKLMFKQLSKVTDNYSVIIVNNGFDDRKFLEKLKPLHYIENKENTGAIRPINQGLEVAAALREIWSDALLRPRPISTVH